MISVTRLLTREKEDVVVEKGETSKDELYLCVLRRVEFSLCNTFK